MLDTHKDRCLAVATLWGKTVHIHMPALGSMHALPAKSIEMHTLGIEPRSQAWKACMMPLHYVCDCITSSPKGKRDSWSVRGEEAGGAHDGIERCGACTASHTRIVCARPHKIACVYQPVHVTGYVCLCQYGHPYLTSGSLM